MMITMNVSDLKTIFDACLKYVDKKDSRFSAVQLNFSAGKCIAYALDGYKLIAVIVPYGDDTEWITCVPVFKLPRDNHTVNILDEGDEITFEFPDARRKETFKKPDCFPENSAQFLEQGEPTFRICFNPNLLRDALHPFEKDEVVALSFTDKNRGCIIEGGSKKALVLPIKEMTPA
jgi:DNA polymerase III sliding clamp (beta) subunit (PCNA family)